MVDFSGYTGFDITNEDMIGVFEEVYAFATKGKRIIMFGPSGAGKEFIARYYFEHYKKASNCAGEFISFNCSQLVRETAHSILFGHVQGSFTDAYKDQKGLFELAEDGVLFLDEIGDLDKSLQVMVNRAINDEEPEAQRLGAEEPYSTENVMVICATERPKKDLNPSLLFRTGHQVQVPGLDARDDDVEEAIKFFCLRSIDKRLDRDFLLSKLLKRKEKDIDENSINDPAIEKMVENIAIRLGPFVRDRDWPGNFRALRTAVDSGMIRANKLNSPDNFVDDVEYYFLHHLGNYSIADKARLLSLKTVTSKGSGSGSSNWLTIVNDKFPELNEHEKIRLSQFFTEFEDIPFKRTIFQEYLNLSTRNAQLRIKDLIDNKKLLERVEGKGYRYRVRKKQVESLQQIITHTRFMELPGPVEEDFMLEKVLEAQGIIENSRCLFVSDKNSKKRVAFLGSLGNKLKETYDIIYYSFHEGSLDDFMSVCIKHLRNLNIDGWFKNVEGESMELNGNICGLAGYFTQSLSLNRRTIIILEGIEVFNTSESQALIENLVYYWNPVQFILGSEKQFFQQRFSNAPGFTELKL